jgi:hypothetical protein
VSGIDTATAAKRVRVVAGSLALLAVVGLIVVWFLSWTLLSHSDKYGRVDIPGSAVLRLPEGEVQVSFRTLLATNGGNGALNVPPLSLGVHPADGVGPDPEVSKDFGTTASVNGDAHVRIWTLQVDHEGPYRVVAGGQVGGYIRPQLTFGAPSSLGDTYLLFVIAIVVLSATAIGAHLVVRRSRTESPPPSA